MELTYRTYTLYNQFIAGRVAVSISKEFAVKMTADFPDLPGLQLPVFSSYQHYIKDSIIGRTTGFYRVDGNDYLIEVELFNHAWHPDLGLPIRKVELRSKVVYNFNDPDLGFMLDDAAKGYRVFKDSGSRDRRTMFNTTSNSRVLDPDYLLYSDPKKWDTYFESPDAQNWNYTAIDRVKTMYAAGRESNGYPYFPATSVGFDPQVYWNGGIPVKVLIIAHISNPDVTLTTPGVIVGAEGWDAGVAGFKYSPKRIYGLLPGTAYYIRTYIKAVRVTGESIDISDQFEYYSDPVQYTTPEERIKPVLVFGASNPIGLTKESFEMRVSFEYIGDYDIDEAGVCWCPESLDRAPVITDGKSTTALRDEFGYDDVSITGLSSGTIYRLRTYVKLTSTGEVLYPSEHLTYHYIRNRGHRYEYGTGAPTPISINMKALVTTSGPAVTLGSIALNQLFWAASDRVSAKITLAGLGGSATWSMGVCYAKAPSVPTVNSSKVVAVIDRGYYDPNYVDITGLDPKAEYNFRAFVTNTAGTAYSDTISLETPEGVERNLSFKILPVNKVTINSAEIGMLVSDSEGISSKGIYWKQGTSTPTASDNVINGDANAGELKRTITNLLPDTTYTYIGFVMVGGFAKYTNRVQFTTLPEPVVKVPIVEVLSITGITPTSAKVTIKVIDNGGADITSLGVCVVIGDFSDKNAPSFYRNFTAAVHQYGEILINISELSANTNFKAAAFAINSKGYAYSALSDFSTPVGVQLPSIELLPYFSSAATPTSVSVDAQITSGEGGVLLRAGVVFSAIPFVAEGIPEDIAGHLGIVENTSILQIYPDFKNFNLRINNLWSNTLYYYALFVQNAAGYAWTELGQFITPSDEILNDTFIDCENIVSQNSITLHVEVSSTIDIKEVGYMHGLSLNSMEKVRLGSTAPYTVIHTSGTSGTIYVKAYVVTADDVTTMSDTFVLRVDSVIDNTIAFNPPIDTNLKYYEYEYDGVVRRWRRNKENGWEKINDVKAFADYSTTPQIVEQYQPPVIAYAKPAYDPGISALSAWIASIENRVGSVRIDNLTMHYSRTAYIEEYDAVYARFVIQLNEDFKFAVTDGISENLYVRDSMGISELEDVGWHANPATRQIWYEFGLNSDMQSIFTPFISAIELGSQLIIAAESKRIIKQIVLNDYCAISAADIFLLHNDLDLDSVINNINNSIRDLQNDMSSLNTFLDSI